MEPKELILSPNNPTPDILEEGDRIQVLKLTIRKYVPEFLRVVQAAAKEEEDSPVVLHQDSFAAAYDDDEYTLLGMAIKYAGLYGVTVHITGKGGETF